MQTWTVDEMLAHHPCATYDRARLTNLWAGRERLSVLDILDLDIPAADRVWAALQAGPHVAPAVERIVTRAVSTHALHCGVPEVEAWAARWLSGEDRTAAAAAAAAAVEAVESASWAASWAARAARASWAAARAARAARAVEEAAEYSHQIDDIRAAVAVTA